VGRPNDVWVPLESERIMRRPSYTSSAAYKWLQLAARLKPGATIEEANAELRVLFKQSVLENEIAELRGNPQFDSFAEERIRGWSLLVEPAGAGFSRTRQQFSRPLFVLMAIVGLLLLIASSNVANLLFARAVAREKEIALRLSLGAGRARLIRQLLTESAVLVTLGGLLGLVSSYLLTSYLVAFLASSNAPIVLDVSPNPATLGFTLAVAILTVVLFGPVFTRRLSRGLCPLAVARAPISTSSSTAKPGVRRSLVTLGLTTSAQDTSRHYGCRSSRGGNSACRIRPRCSVL
jgi:predicted lysophospholipase L1 biosynthesis ABC-type transport system permease subunit